jgi:alpha-amylase
MAKKRIQLQFAFHHHQPVGNFTESMEACCRGGYLPLLQAMDRADPLKFHLSYSAPVLEYLEAHLPAYVELLSTLVKRGQVEILAAAHHEPILADLEEDDRLAHLQASLHWWKSRLGIVPQGVWLAEGVWENDLARTLHCTGLRHTLMAKERFIQAGVPAARVQGYFITDYQGKICRLFPVEEQLQRLMPFGQVDEVVNYLRRLAGRGDVVLTFADNAERWGVWPGTSERVLASGYIDALFQRLKENAEWIQIGHFSEVLDRTPSSGRCYLPPGISKELGIWSLPDEARMAFQQARQNLEVRFDADQFLPYFRVGSWAGFRARYAEANWMHKKGVWLKQRALAHPQARVRDAALQLLREAQCNTAYWYGTAGGIYAAHLREAVWSRLLAAQALLSEKLPLAAEQTDLDADGEDEIVVSGSHVSGVVAPKAGGALVEWGDLESRTQVFNVMTRHRESSVGQADRTIRETDATAQATDPCDRHAFQELFLKKQTTAEDLASGRAIDLGDFYGQPYRLVARAKPEPGQIEVTVERVGAVRMSAPVPVRVRKTYRWSQDQPRQLEVDFTVANEGTLPVHALLATEVNVGLPGGEDSITLESGGRTYGPQDFWYEGTAHGWAVRSTSRSLGLTLSWDGEGVVWSYPVITVQGDGGSTRQGQALVSGRRIDLEPAGSQTWQLRVSIVTL